MATAWPERREPFAGSVRFANCGPVDRLGVRHEFARRSIDEDRLFVVRGVDEVVVAPNDGGLVVSVGDFLGEQDAATVSLLDGDSVDPFETVD
jgi:hypothetical protein